MCECLWRTFFVRVPNWEQNPDVHQQVMRKQIVIDLYSSILHSNGNERTIDSRKSQISKQLCEKVSEKELPHPPYDPTPFYIIFYKVQTIATKEQVLSSY